MIPPALLTEFTPEQLKLFISVIEKEEDDCARHWAFQPAEDLQLLLVQLHNALNVVSHNEKIYQS